MNFTELLKFIPLIIGGVLAYHLIFRVGLPDKNIGSIFTYFIGILIVFLAVSWLIRTFLPDFANELLEAGRNGAEWNQFIDNSETVVNDAFNNTDDGGGGGGDTTVPADPTAVRILVVTVTPAPSIPGNETNLESAAPTVHTVVAGDTLLRLSRTYGVTVEDIRAANGIPANSNLIRVGDQIIIPAR